MAVTKHTFKIGFKNSHEMEPILDPMKVAKNLKLDKSRA